MTYMAREPYANFWPKVADTAFVAESADLIGDVTIGEHASIWYHTTLRADINKIVIGDYSNIQDNSCIHLADDFGCYVGKYVTVGHGVILHACTVEDRNPRIIIASGRRNTSRWLPGIRSESSIPVFNI